MGRVKLPKTSKNRGFRADLLHVGALLVHNLDIQVAARELFLEIENSLLLVRNGLVAFFNLLFVGVFVLTLGTASRTVCSACRTFVSAEAWRFPGRLHQAKDALFCFAVLTGFLLHLFSLCHHIALPRRPLGLPLMARTMVMRCGQAIPFASSVSPIARSDLKFVNEGIEHNKPPQNLMRKRPAMVKLMELHGSSIRGPSVWEGH